MNTRILLDHEPVADGGYFARAVLLIEGTPPQTAPLGHSFGPTGSLAVANRLAAENVRVSVRPGEHAEFVQMRHTFHSEGRGNLLTIHIGDVYCLDRIRIRMDALVGPGVDGDEVEVGRIVVLARLNTEEGPELETVELPLLLSPEHGGQVRAAVSRMPVARNSTFGRRKGA